MNEYQVVEKRRFEVEPISIVKDLSDHGALGSLREAYHILWTANLEHLCQFITNIRPHIHKKNMQFILSKKYCDLMGNSSPIYTKFSQW